MSALLLAALLAAGPGQARPDAGAQGPLVVGSELVFAKDATLEAGEIVFRPGGRIRVANGARLTLKAHRISAEDGAVIDIDGKGEAGEPGKAGAPCPGCQAPVQRVRSASAFAAALQQCQESGVGGQGGQGGAGKPGASVEIQAEEIRGRVRCDVSGGEPGRGGAGGPGLVLERPSPAGAPSRTACPAGPSGPPGAFGADGRCVIRSRQ
ncbi:hypothetical protein [Anaeromyxobacter paludicola]|uniref:Collagen triple helix repeat protein n=1 Tax=Anaeromyxobacter paludicola TaxID=2918171 RepID=A0ABM7XA66_9BACT|nr:hypothetical protein [Anaeromyxobacter paludicola]BDG08741.1 hypothetical protein AMPC_18540 [Anaeromyxobacter paludicola]